MQSGHFDVARAEFPLLAEQPPNEAEGLKLPNRLLISSTSQLSGVVVEPLIGYFEMGGALMACQ